MSNARWVDLQVNGHNGIDFSDPALTGDDVVRAAEELLAAGTEVFLPTLVTRSEELYRRNLPLIYHAIAEHGLLHHVPGIHLEGPMITAKGSHDPAWIVPCSAGSVRHYFDLSEGFIKLLTLAADAPDAEEAIAEAVSLGIVPSVGHHNAGYADIRRAADAGCRALTHLGNACPNLLDRHENPLLAGLAEPRMTAFVITDGHHLPPELIALILKVKGAEKVIVTSDACSFCGFPDGHYDVWGNHAVLENGRLYNPEKQCLVASVATMNDCMEFLASLELLTEKELEQVGRTNALKLLGLEVDR